MRMLSGKRLLLLCAWSNMLGGTRAFVAPARTATTRPPFTTATARNKLENNSQSSSLICLHATSTPASSSSFLPSSSSRRRRKSSDLEIGIQTAQMLLSEKKRDAFRQDIVRQYPLLPASVIESVMDVVADGFAAIAPKQLKQALQPGGVDKARPQLKSAIVAAALEQDAVQQFPVLTNHDKTKILEWVVDAALDRLLEDAQWVLLPPQSRLEALYEEIHSIRHTELTLWQRVWFDVQRRPLRYTSGTALTAFLLYAQVRHRGSWKQAGIATVYGGLALGKLAGAALGTLGRFVMLRGYIFLKVLAKILLSTKPAYGPWKYLPTYC